MYINTNPKNLPLQHDTINDSNYQADPKKGQN
jgi:hypothetical protein